MTDRNFLVVAPQYSPTRGLLADAARRRGMEVEVLPALPGTVDLRGREGVHYYGGPKYAAEAGDGLPVALLAPDGGWLAALPHEFTRRRLTLSTLGAARELPGPLFVKPPTDKSFPAAVYADGGRLPSGPRLPPGLSVQISEVVMWAAEFRLYVLDGAVRTGSQYATYGLLDSEPLTSAHRHHDAVLAFAGDVLAACAGTLPSAVVLDVGLLATGEWAVVEANMAWFSSCYAADPEQVLDVVLRAGGPADRVAPRDLPYCRQDG
ncbi:ATP-grasp domain-containing protein [Streptomyces sp. NPDC004111]|uniref:ATP-grasp domain-containing protein n=1 Tax=Streptomyces sp. NPDC004111 TaxID=3364690 RepID=UPI003699CA5A